MVKTTLTDQFSTAQLGIESYGKEKLPCLIRIIKLVNGGEETTKRDVNKRVTKRAKADWPLWP